ncbi:L,D-transpeptidase family protein [Massilia sp. TWR1-2-2]|uniref:L,D-transpeptidase family protein n=1 Tax=Massilia sp. TWR1-2-2 TaxID=2804584 RepID=UPI003CF26B90
MAAQCAWAGSVPERIRSLASEYAQAVRTAASPYDERAWLERFYGARDYAPAWTGGAAAQAQALLGKAEEHGLAAQDYDPRALAVRMRAHGSVAADEAADQDAALTLALLRYLADLHAGRVRSDFAVARVVDPVKLLQQALADRNLAAAVEAAEPRLAVYQRLKAALAEYRKLAALPSAAVPAIPSTRAIEVGAAYAGAPELGARLALLGDLAPEAVTPASTYSAELVQAVKRFQDRHGLDADGKLGRQTVAALNVPLSARVRQIELSMERLRWLPDLSGGPFIAVNLPSFRLWAFKAAGAAPVLATRVIVGKAVRTQTPLFIGTLRYIEFNPYWNVPPSILRDEILPAVLKDPGYLVKNDMEVAGSGAQMVDAATLAALRSGKMRVRQRPGPKNALGGIKFGLPNTMNIYLHSTPARALFARSRRDFSHGCIRVEDTVALANFVLGDQAGWTPEAIDAAMAPGPNRTVQLKASMPVVIFYATAIIDVDGRPLFPDDVYRLDGALERTLAAFSAQSL